MWWSLLKRRARQIWQAPRIIGAALLVYVAVLVLVDVSRDGDIYGYHERACVALSSSMGAMYQNEAVEYPPGAIYVIVGVGRLASRLPDVADQLGWFRIYNVRRDMRTYKFLFRFGMMLAALGCGAIILRRVTDVDAQERLGDQRLRACFYAFALFGMRHVAYDRLDMLVGFALIASLELVNSERYKAAIVVLALGTAYKLVPALVLPFLLLRVAVAQQECGWRRVFRRQLMLLALFTITLVGAMLPAYLVGGERSFAFWSYHKQRRIDFGSAWAAVSGVLKHVAEIPTQLHLQFGSADVQSLASPTLIALATILVPIGLLLILASTWRGLRAADDDAARRRVMRLHAALAVLWFLLTNKVFSPQYMLWLIPLCPLVPLARVRRNWFFAGVMAACVLTE